MAVMYAPAGYSPEYRLNLFPDFQVNNNQLDLNFDPGNNYAGNIGVQRANHQNDTLFFWAFEKESGSLTAAAGDRSTEPWAIWLQGGYARVPSRRQRD